MRRVAYGSAILLAALLGCDENPLRPIAASFPTGSYEVTILATDIPARTDLQHIPGTWRIVFHPTASFEALRDGDLVVSGSFSATEDEVTITEESGTFGCAEPSDTYAWAFDGTHLTLDDVVSGEVTASCGQRNIVLALKPLTRIPMS